MKNRKMVTAVAAVLASLSAHAYAANSILQSNLSANPSGQFNGREIVFKLPINGDTKNCIVNISYGEKPGVGINNDGDTHINGQGNVDRRRTYSADGTYRFVAKAKSGCTGEAAITVTIGNGANERADSDRPALVIKPIVPPATVSVDVSASNDVGLMPAKITGVVVTPHTITLGNSFVVTVNGKGVGAALAMCFSGFYLDKMVDPKVYGYSTSYNHFKWPTFEKNTTFPRTTTLTPTEEGTYEVRIVPGGGFATCGLDHPENIPGSITTVTVLAKPAS